MESETLCELYVMFDESEDPSDPAYAYASEATLVEASADADANNPCVGSGVVRRAPVLPMTPDEIRAYAAILGWDVTLDSEGSLVLHTGVQANQG